MKKLPSNKDGKVGILDAQTVLPVADRVRYQAVMVELDYVGRQLVEALVIVREYFEPRVATVLDRAPLVHYQWRRCIVLNDG